MGKIAKQLAAGTLALLFLAVIIELATRQPKFTVGPSLPPGKVSPQLVSTWDMAVLLAPDGSLWAWGGTLFKLTGLFATSTTTEVPKRVGTNADWCQISSSHMHLIALKTDGSLWGMGWNAQGQLAQPQAGNRFTEPTPIGTNTDWQQISVGMGHSLALKTNGSLCAWGQNDRGQVGIGTTNNVFSMQQIGLQNDWKSVTAGAFNSYALRQDGTIWGWGYGIGGAKDDLSPNQIDPGTNWTSIFACDFVLLALKADGTLWIRGQNAHMTAPDFLTGATATLTQIGHDKDWVEVYAGQNCFLGRKKDGRWWGCGQNTAGRLGVGLHTPPGAPVPLSFEFEPWALATGHETTILLTKDGALWTWGKRLGAGKSGIIRLKETLNQLVSHLPGNRRPFKTQDVLTDTTPHKLWQLPPETVIEEPVNKR